MRVVKHIAGLLVLQNLPAFPYLRSNPMGPGLTSVDL